MADILARYLFNEAASGSAVATISDNTTNTNDLTVTYNSNANWVDSAAGKGLLISGSGAVVKAALSASIATALSSTTSASITFVIDMNSGNDAYDGDRLLHIGTDSTDVPTFDVSVLTDRSLRVFFGNAATKVAFPPLPSGVVVVTIAIDTTQAVQADRIRCKYNGTLQTASSGYLSQGATLPTIAASGNLLSLGNTATGNRDIDGTIYYAEFGTGVYTSTEESTIYNALSVNNDVDWDANQAPVADNDTFSIFDNAANGSTVGTFTATDSDGTVDVYSITGSTLAINNAGVITIADNTGIEAGTDITATVTATDNDGATDTALITVTVSVPALSIDSIDDANPTVGDQITVGHSNALGTLTTPDFTISSQNGTQAVLDIPDITSLVLTGETYPTISFDEAVTITLSDGTNTADVELTGIQKPVGTYFEEITSIPAGSDFENDVGATTGMFSYYFNITGNLTVLADIGKVLDDGLGGSYSYKLYNGEWGAPTTNTIHAKPQSAVSIDAVTPSRNGAVIEFSYPGTDATGFQYRLDDGSWIAATSPLTLSGLTAETLYEFDITPVNSGRIGDISTTTFTTQDAVDTTPNAFSFTAQTGVARSAAVVFGPMTVLGVDAGVDVPVSITNGTYSVSTDGGNTYGAETSANTNVRLNYLIRVHHNAAATYDTQRQTTLTVGGVSAIGSSTTLVNPASGISESSGNPLPASLYVRSGTPYSLSQHVNNPDSVALNYAVAQGSPALPTGVSLNASTGEITTTTDQYTPVDGLSIEVTVA